MNRARVVIAWVLLVGGLLGFALSCFEVIAPNEPKLVLLLSWAALIYEGFNGVQIAHDGGNAGEKETD